MDEEARRILREAMELEQEEGYIRDALREMEKRQLETAIFLKARYMAYRKVGFTEERAYALIVNEDIAMIQTMFRNPENPNNRK